jgi:hypothetical protein
MKRITLRLWHSIWAAHWQQRLDDAVTFTGSDGKNYAATRYNYHIRKLNNLPQ